MSVVLLDYLKVVNKSSPWRHQEFLFGSAVAHGVWRTKVSELQTAETIKFETERLIDTRFLISLHV